MDHDYDSTSFPWTMIANQLCEGLPWSRVDHDSISFVVSN